jgi:hypothetical protein
MPAESLDPLRKNRIRVLVLFGLAIAAAAPAAQPVSFSRIEIPAGPSCCSMVSGDFNGDGKPDLAVTFSDSLDAGGRQLLILMGNGDGMFTARVTVDLGQSFLLVAAVDVNSDKKPDLIITASTAILLCSPAMEMEPLRHPG